MPIRTFYDTKVRAGQIEHDPAQAKIIDALDALCEELETYTPARKTAALGWLFGSKRTAEAPRGLYIWGGVGRGKSMLMDMFFERVEISKKRRVHFHAFMAEVHAAIFKYRQALKRGEVKGEDPIGPVAEGIARDATLLCFDEFTVTDIADAMILGRLFKELFARGIVIVATSNVEPKALYRDGLNRDLFLPSIELIESQMEVARLEARADYRMEKLAGAETFHVPADEDARSALDATFKALTGRESGRAISLTVLGRSIAVPQSRGNVARFSFHDLCEKPLGAQDYLTIAKRFRSVIVDDIPVLTSAQRNEAKRFIILIDTLYEAHVKFFASAEAPPERLFEAEEGREAFEFQRTISRLNEMRSRDYMALPYGPNGAAGRDRTAGIIDT
jgi:cell division protein ZapE